MTEQQPFATLADEIASVPSKVAAAIRNSPPFWITVRNGQVVKIAEQYLP